MEIKSLNKPLVNERIAKTKSKFSLKFYITKIIRNKMGEGEKGRKREMRMEKGGLEDGGT